MKQTLIVLFILLLSHILPAQGFEANVQKDTSTNYKKSFLEMYFTLNNFYITDKDHFSNKKGSGFEFGMLYKWKLAKMFGVYVGLSLADNNFALKQDSTINFPTNTLYDEAKIELNGIRLTPGITFSPAKKCNPHKIGINLHPFIEYYWTRNLIVKNKINSTQPPYAKEFTTTFSKLSYINNFSYGISGEFTAYGVSIGVAYYLSDIVKPDFTKSHNWPQFPNIKIYAKYTISLE